MEGIFKMLAEIQKGQAQSLAQMQAEIQKGQAQSAQMQADIQEGHKVMKEGQARQEQGLARVESEIQEGHKVMQEMQSRLDGIDQEMGDMELRMESKMESKMTQGQAQIMARLQSVKSDVHCDILSGLESLKSNMTARMDERLTGVESELDNVRCQLSRAVDEVREQSMVLDQAGRGLPGRVKSPSSPGSMLRVSPDAYNSTIVDTLRIANVSVSKFDGSAFDYHVFRNQFVSSIDVLNVSKAEKLSKLLDACVGKAKSVLSPCALMRPEEGYDRALELLRERFGNPFLVAKAWLDRVFNIPSIRPGDAKALESFTDQLVSCSGVLSELGMVDELDCQTKLQALAAKLPVSLRDRWRREAHQCMKRKGKVPKLPELVEFLQEVSAELNNPLFGVGSSLEQPRAKMFAACADSSVVPASANLGSCYCCSESHPLYKCSRFQAMSPAERLAFVKSKRLCFNCYYPNHLVRQCKKPAKCGAPCKRKHSSLLHDAFVLHEGKRSYEKPVGTAAGSDQAVSSPTVSDQSGLSNLGATNMFVRNPFQTKIALPILAVWVRAPGLKDYVKTYALLDSGSSHTFCSSDLCEMLGVQGKGMNFDMTTMTGVSSSQSRVLPFEVAGVGVRRSRRSPYLLPSVLTVNQFPKLVDNIIGRAEQLSWPHLRSVPIPECFQGRVMMIIGQDVPEVIATREIVHGGPGEPVASRTRLGWVISGPLKGSSLTPPSVQVNFLKVADPLSEQVKRFWEIDSGPHDKPEWSLEDERVMDLWNNSLQRIGSQYQFDIPLRPFSANLPSSKPVATKRLTGLGKRFLRDPEFGDRYTTEMSKLLAQGVAERAPPTDSERVWYIPHHGVVNPRKPGKLRVVFDCAAETMGVSLNKLAYQGPDLTNNLFGVLMRFRLYSVGIMADIEGMFNQVKVSPKHRDLLRFLWWPSGKPDEVPAEYRMTTHLFGGVWSPSCANYALLTAAKELGRKYGSDVEEAIKNSFYVDDCLKSVSTAAEGKQLVQQLYSGLAEHGFHLTKWVSNEPETLSVLPPGESAVVNRQVQLGNDLPSEKVLGLGWDTKLDTFSVRSLEKKSPFTRRGVLSTLSSVYDPLGLVAPFVLKAKVLLQEGCRRNLGWDDPIPEDIRQPWEKWLSELGKLAEVQLSRCLIPSSFLDSQCELHYFSDASEHAYATVVYLRLVNRKGEVRCSFVLSRSRLAPLKTMTIPRLELSAAVLSVRTHTLLMRELSIPVHKTYFWTDSMIVLHYISNEAQRYQTFVANRVAEIRRLSQPDQWHFLGSSLNPADEASRGLWASELIRSDRWLPGPSFLRLSSEFWPQRPCVDSTNLDHEVELKRPIVNSLMAVQEPISPTHRFVSYFSTWNKLVKATAWLMKFVQWVGAKGEPPSKNLLPADMVSAEAKLVGLVQAEYLNHTFVTKNPKAWKRLRPVADGSGVLRVGGRLKDSDLTYEEKHPAILPKSGHVSTLLVRHYHENVCAHGGSETVLGRMRERYWMIGGRSLVRTVLHSCVACRKLQSCSGQLMADLPPDRALVDQAAFASTGVDCFGPFVVKLGRREEKRYGCMFTCLSMRAVHIEVLNSLSSDSFINGLVRFVSRRGLPHTIRSDNGTNFVGAHKELRRALQDWKADKKVKTFMIDQSINWKFNPPGASHMGGSWERMIRSARRSLFFLAGKTTLCDERLTTLMCAVEETINSRPLTYVSSDPDDPKPLCPNDLLRVYQKPVLSISTLPHDRFGTKWRHTQLLANQFWVRWRREYIVQLQSRQKWLKEKEALKAGDIVLVSDDSAPRGCWPLGKVTEVNQGRDGLVRSVEVKVGDKVLSRPITKLVFLER